MKIGFDAKRAISNNTGLGNYSRDTIRVLAHYFTNNQYLLYTSTENINTTPPFIANNKHIVINQPRSLFDKTFKTYWRSKNIVKDLSAHKIDIYHGLSNELPIGIEKTSIKTIVTIHDLIFMRFPQFFNILDRKIYYKKSKSACQRANKIIAVSNQTKKDIVKFLNIPEEKITVVHQGCNQVFQQDIAFKKQQSIIKKYRLPKDYLLYVGTIEERKNLLTLLRALKDLTKEKLIIIGDGKAYKMKCLKFINKHKLSDRVFFLSGLSPEEIAVVYRSAEIMIYPSIFEGFGIPIIEALFSKTPVITTKGGCFAEAGGENSQYINPLSVVEIKAAIMRIKESPEIRNNMINKGLRYVQKFTDDKVADSLMKVYTNL